MIFEIVYLIYSNTLICMLFISSVILQSYYSISIIHLCFLFFWTNILSSHWNLTMLYCQPVYSSEMITLCNKITFYFCFQRFIGFKFTMYWYLLSFSETTTVGRYMDHVMNFFILHTKRYDIGHKSQQKHLKP